MPITQKFVGFDENVMSQNFADLLFQHQAQLIGWCAQISGDVSAAEDLAQETIITAWRIRHKLADVNGLKPWLYRIARYVCLRWQRQPGQENLPLEAEWLADPLDLEAELEQRELSDLLDQALGWLPPDTRDAMAARYLDGQSPEEVAFRLGISENALAVRLHRGRQTLHQTIRTHLRKQAEAYDLLDPSDDWQTVRLWCYGCGKQHLRVRFDPLCGNFTLYCPGCGFALEDASGISSIIGGVQGIKSVIKRLANWSNQQFSAAGSTIDCTCCGQTNIIRISPRETHRGSEIELDGSCSRCGRNQRESLYGQAIHLPAGQRFWRTQERIRIVPHRFLEMDGQTVVQTTLESVRSASRLHVFSAYDTGRVLRVETMG
jgi:RNA polymerase sigma factor (sigma-70 family)